MKCEKNIGSADRMIRVVFAVAFILTGLFLVAEPWNYVSYLIALVLLITGVTQMCCLYSLLGMNTLEKKEAPKKAAPKKR
ncbi:MAG: DUF2892 domain-containing protein [Candidatus Micrarchaeota archaeon]